MLAGLRSVYILQRRDSEGSREFGDTGGTPHIKTNRPVPGDHQEAVGAESTGDVSHIEPNERSHGVGAEGNCVSRLVLSHLRLQGNTHRHHNNQREYGCDAISNLEHRCLMSDLVVWQLPSVPNKAAPKWAVPSLASCIISPAVGLPFNKISYCDVGFLESLSIFG